MPPNLEKKNYDIFINYKMTCVLLTYYRGEIKNDTLTLLKKYYITQLKKEELCYST